MFFTANISCVHAASFWPTYKKVVTSASLSLMQFRLVKSTCLTQSPTKNMKKETLRTFLNKKSRIRLLLLDWKYFAEIKILVLQLYHYVWVFYNYIWGK